MHRIIQKSISVDNSIIHEMNKADNVILFSTLNQNYQAP